MGTDHTISTGIATSGRGTYYAGDCSCGWTGPRRRRESDAMADAERHADMEQDAIAVDNARADEEMLAACGQW